MQKESAMNRTTVAVDLAKNRFELAIADSQCRIFQHERKDSSNPVLPPLT
jgi:hypothetical protein